MTTGINDPNRLDLYVEKIAAYMNLDDAQRIEVVRELRSHLDEARDSGVSRGMSRKRAEDEAMDRFGSPEALAGKFGTISGKTWIIFESLAYALCLFAVFWFSLSTASNPPDFITGTHIIILSGLVAGITFAGRLWNRVQVNGSLRIHRFLRPTLVIPFADITAITMDRWHLMGARKIRIQYAGKKASYSAGWPNARCVGIALEVLSPSAIQPRAAEYFRKLRLTDGQESLLLKSLFTLGWIALAAMLAVNFPPLWRGEGISIWFGLVLMGSMILISLQYYFQASRAKRGVAMLLAAGMVIMIPVSVAIAVYRTAEFGH